MIIVKKNIKNEKSVEDEINDDFNYEFNNMLHDEDEQTSNI
jgi:hypothetical protein